MPDGMVLTRRHFLALSAALAQWSHLALKSQWQAKLPRSRV
jgi:hypothetical protein